MTVSTDPKAILHALRFQDTTYSPDAAMFLQYVDVAALVVMVHDWLILLDIEVEYVWKAEWSIGKIFYLVSRYGPYPDMIIMIISHDGPSGTLSESTCEVLNKVSIWSAFFEMAISECILLLRTNALYSKSKRIMIPLVGLYAAAVAVGVVVTWRYLEDTVFGPSDMSMGMDMACNIERTSSIVFYDFLLLLILELAIVTLTVWKGFRDFSSGAPLLRVLYRDSISFFLALFVLTLAAMLVLVFASAQYSGLMTSITRSMHCLICCRILLNLKQAVRPRGASVDAPGGVAFVGSHRQKMSQPEMLKLEAVELRSYRGDSEGQVTGDRGPSIEIE